MDHNYINFFVYLCTPRQAAGCACILSFTEVYRNITAPARGLYNYSLNSLISHPDSSSQHIRGGLHETIASTWVLNHLLFIATV